MRKLVCLIKSNYRKDIKQVIPFFLILIFASVLLCIGFRMADYRDLFEKNSKEFHTPDMFYQEYGDRDGLIANIVPNDYIMEVVHNDVVTGLGTVKNVRTNRTESFDITVTEYDENRVFDYHLTECAKTPYENGIYVTEYIRTRLNLSVGDEITVRVGDTEERSYILEGVYDSLCMNSYFIGTIECMVKHADFVSLTDEILAWETVNTDNAAVVVNSYINFKPGTDLADGMSAYTKDVAKYSLDIGGSCWGYTLDEVADVVLIIPNILSVVCCSIAVIVALISIVVTGFVINNNIKRDIKNIGALKAIGYTNNTVRAATVLEFSFVAFLAGVLGVAVSSVLFPKVEIIVRPMVGLRMTGAFTLFTAGVTVLFLTGLAVIITMLATKRLVKIKPMIALRFGLESHSFKKNPLPLADRKGNVNLLLAAKTMLQSKAHNVVLSLVSVSVAFIMLFAFVLYYNSTVDITAFMRLLQGDTPDIFVTFDESVCGDRESAAARERELLSVEGVVNVNRANFVYSTTNDVTSYIVGCDHVEQMDCGLCEGSMPQQDNEIVIGTVLAKRAGIKVGDEVTVAVGNMKQKFVVSGFQQSFYGMGARVYMSVDNLESLGQELREYTFRIKVKNPSKETVEAVVERISEAFGDEVTEVRNYYKENHSDENLPIVAVRYVTFVLTVLVLLICFLVISIMVKTEIINKQKEFGIKKAIGFTSGQLRIQLALSTIPVMLIGTVIGSVLSYLFGNGLVTLMCGSFGISDIGFIRVPVLILITTVVITVYTFLLAFVMSAKIKKITPYQLIIE